MKMEYRVKQSYGNVLWHPVSKDATFVCRLNGTKTITDDIVKIVNAFYPATTWVQVI